jgi:hypothetical protein
MADALVAYCIASHFQPRLIIEVSSGFSSLVLGDSAQETTARALSASNHFHASFFARDFLACDP